MKMIDVFWRRAEREHHTVTEPLRGFLEGRIPPATLVAFAPEYRTLSDDEAAEVLYKRTLGGEPVRL